MKNNNNRNFLFTLLILLTPIAGVFAQFEPEKIKAGLFIENKGQWNTNVLYRSEIPSGQLYIEKNRFLFNFYDQEAMSDHHHGHNQEVHKNDVQQRAIINTPQQNLIRAHAYEVAFIGCQNISSAEGIDPTTYNYNYFKGSDQSKWGSNAHAYSKTILNNLYPKISLACLGQETGFKYEYYVQPGGNVSSIKMKYNGVDTVFIRNGELHIQTSLNSFYEQRPYSYQEINGTRVSVPCEFRLDQNVLTFAFPKGYNKNFALVIDPQLIFSTYSGSTADNWGNSATYDDDGNTYMVGIAFNQGYPATLGAYQINYNGFPETEPIGTPQFDPDVAIMKFDPLGNLLYATYLGGTETEVPSSCIVNSKKELIIMGFTSSDGGLASNGTIGLPFPTTVGAYDVTFNGGSLMAPLGFGSSVIFDKGSDIFITALNETGSSLQYSTFLGGSDNDGVSIVGSPICRNYGDQFRGEIYCDELDDVYIVTKTFSSNIINTSVPGYDLTYNGILDGYVCKLSNNLSTMLWNTYIGGSDNDASYSIRVASDKSIYITGGTLSGDFPTTAGTIKTTLGASDTDGFITHLSADGTSILNSTFIGTDTYDQCFLIQLDKAENVYVLGQTLGDFPMSPGVFGQPSRGQFIQKIDPTLSTVLLSTTFGNVQNRISIVPTAFLVNNCDNILISGWGGAVNSSYLGGSTFNLSTTSNAFMSTTDGSDFYLMVLEKDFSGLLYGSFFGGLNEADHVDGGTSRFDKNGIVYQSVCGSCGGTSRFPTTANAVSRTNNSINCNNACFKFDLSNLRADFTMSKTDACDTTTITLVNTSTGGVAFEWHLGDGTIVNGPGPITHTYSQAKEYTIKLIVTDLTTCIGKDTAQKIFTIFPKPSIGVELSDTTICKGDTITILNSCKPFYTYTWSPAIEMLNPNTCDAQFFPSTDRSYFLTVVDTNNCTAKDTIDIKVATLAKGINWVNMTTCDGKPTVQLSNPSTGPLNYFWTFGDGNSSTEASPVHEYSKGGSYPIVVDIYNDYCATNERVLVNIDDILIPNLFTPNNDGKNDCFEIKGLYPNWRVDIYNPWNSRVFKADSYANDFCGDGVNTSVYYYLVCAPYGDCCKSWVHILISK